MTWHRLDTDTGRKLASELNPLRATEITRTGDLHTIRTPGRLVALAGLTRWALLGELTVAGVEPPTPADFEWLGGPSERP